MDGSRDRNDFYLSNKPRSCARCVIEQAVIEKEKCNTVYRMYQDVKLSLRVIINESLFLWSHFIIIKSFLSEILLWPSSLKLIRVMNRSSFGIFSGNNSRKLLKSKRFVTWHPERPNACIIFRTVQEIAAELKLKLQPRGQPFDPTLNNCMLRQMWLKAKIFLLYWIQNQMLLSNSWCHNQNLSLINLI